MQVCEKWHCQYYTKKEKNHCTVKYRIEEGFCETYVGKGKEADGDVQHGKDH